LCFFRGLSEKDWKTSMVFPQFLQAYS
jgi:hypothetical protein